MLEIDSFWIHLIVMGLVLLAFHWEMREQKEIDHDFSKLSEIERQRWKTKMKVAEERSSDEDLEFLAACLDHPHDEVAKLASAHLSENASERALNILLDRIQKLDLEIESKKTVLQNQLDNSFHARLVSERPEQISNPVGYCCGQVHPKLLSENYKLLEPYRTGANQIFEGEALRHLLTSLVEDQTAPFDQRSWALLSLSAFPEAPEHRLIESCLHGRQHHLKIATIQLIGHFKLKEFRPRLEVEVMNREPSVSIEAMYSLLQMECIQSLSKIEHISQYGHGMVKEAARYVCRQLQKLPT